MKILKSELEAIENMLTAYCQQNMVGDKMVTNYSGGCKGTCAFTCYMMCAVGCTGGCSGHCAAFAR